MAPAALRIPDPRVLPLPMRFIPFGPQIFVHEGARQGLERRLQVAFDGPVQLAVTDNRRRMVTHTLSRGTLRVRLHMMFLDAPDRVLDALVRYVVHNDRQSSQVVGDFINRNGHRIRATRSASGPLRTAGKVHDLQRILDEVTDKYFGGAVADVLITWGRRTRPTAKRTTIKLGSYSTVERLVRIHPSGTSSRTSSFTSCCTTSSRASVSAGGCCCIHRISSAASGRSATTIARLRGSRRTSIDCSALVDQISNARPSIQVLVPTCI
jgi:hypothetical protein